MSSTIIIINNISSNNNYHQLIKKFIHINNSIISNPTLQKMIIGRIGFDITYVLVPIDCLHYYIIMMKIYYHDKYDFSAIIAGLNKLLSSQIFYKSDMHLAVALFNLFFVQYKSNN